MSASPVPLLPADVAQPTGFLHTLLTMSLTAVAVLRPVFAADSRTIQDFAWVYLNPAGQRMLGQPAQPTGSLLTLFPAAQADGVFEKCCQAYATGEPRRNQTNYQADGLDGYFLLVAQRYEDVLVVNFTDTNDQPRTSAEEALRASQTQEQQARRAAEAAGAAAEAARADLENVFTQAPAMICIFRGPEHTFEFVNPPYQALVGERPLLGKPIAVAMPELTGQPIFGLLDHVYQTGETFRAYEMLVQLDHANVGEAELEKRYYNFIYQARRNRQGHIDGILVFAYEVTPQVHARQQVDTLNEELAAINEELRATNEEFQAANMALHEAQAQLQQLNDELEARVQERTRQSAQHSTRLERLLQEAPAAIAVLDGPELVVEFLNARYVALFPERQLLGKPILESLPELLDGPGAGLLRQVYATGVTFEGRQVRMDFARPADGQREARYFDFIYQARYDTAGQIDGLTLFGFEVTEQVLARQQVQTLNEDLAAINEELTATNEELNDSNTRLTRTNVDLDTFVYTASHDLKAPITNIEGLLLALQQQLPPAAQQDPEVGEILGMMHGSVERFSATIGHLTDVSRLQQSQNLPSEQVLLLPVVEDVRLDLAPLLLAAQAQLTVDIDPEVRVLFAPKNLRSLVYNLLSNALKYRDPSRPAAVALRATRAAGQVVFMVRDNGLGLTATQQERLFGLFQRLHTHVEGTGVGLYMVKRLVENVGGRIAVESQMGVGTTFTVTMPGA